VAAIIAVILLLRRRARASAAAQVALRAFEKAAGGKPVAHGYAVGPSTGLASLQRSVDALHDALQRQADSLRSASLLGSPRAAKRWDVFLSYRREDHALVDIIADKLTLAGLRVFVDRRGAMAGKPFDSELFAAIASSTTFTPVITLAALHALSEGGTRDQEGAADFALGEALAALHLWRCGVVPLVYPLLVGPEVPSATDVRGSDWAPLLGSEAFRDARAALSARPHAPTLALVEALCQRHPGTPPLAEDLRNASVRDLICGPHGGAAHRPAPVSESSEVEEVGSAPSTLQCGLLSFDACLLLGPTRDMDLHIRSRFAAHLRAALQRTAAEAGEDEDAGGDAFAALSAAHARAHGGAFADGGSGSGAGGGNTVAGAAQRVAHSRIVSEAAPEALIPWADITLQQPVGQGAFGTVHAALWGDTPVAVKLLSLVAPPRHVLRQLQREGYLMASIRHPHVCACFGLIVDPPRYGLVLELCAGGTLTDALLAEDESAVALAAAAPGASAADAAVVAARAPPRLAPLSMAQRCRWGAQLAAGMAYLHGRPPPLGPVVHGDLKSPNLLLQQPGAMLKIADFGLAKLRLLTTSSGVSAAAAVAAGGACTVGWTAPEVLAAYDARLSPESDMYAFGMVLWELAARRLPWGRLTAGEVIDLVKAKGQRPPMPADCPRPLAEIITRCWAQAPVERPAHFDGVGRVLAELAVEQAEHDA
jgi:hypothetical protein